MSGAFGIAMVRNEADLVGPWAAHMLAELDGLVVADNRSDDGTRELLAAIAEGAGPRMLVLDEPRFAYRQADTMNELARVALEEGAAWVVPADADEWWYAPSGLRIADTLAGWPEPVVSALAFDMVPQPDDPADADPFRRIRWRRSDSRMSKVAFRPDGRRVLLMGNHGIAGDGTSASELLRIRHYPYRTREQARAKVIHGAAALAATPFDRAYGAHWRDLGGLDEGAFDRWWDRWTARTLDLVLDPLREEAIR